MSTFRNLSNTKSIRQPTVLATIQSNNKTNNKSIRETTVLVTVKSNSKTTVLVTVKSNNKTTGKPIRQPTVLATVKPNKKTTYQTMDQPTVLATVNVCNEANNIITDKSLVADQAEVKILKDTVDASHNADLLVETSLDSAVELSLLSDKGEDKVHITREIPLTWPDGPVPSILVTGPTNSSLTSAAYYANMPKSISPGFLQVPGARPSFYNTPSLSTRWSLRKTHSFRANLRDAELANPFLDNGDTDPVLNTSLNNLLNFDVLADWEKVEVPKNAASVEEDASFNSERNFVSVADVDAALRSYTKPTPAPQCSPLPTSTDSLAPTVTMTGPFTSGWRPTLSAHKATETLIKSSSVASKNNSIGSSKAKIGCKSSSSSPFQIKSIGSGKATTGRKSLSLAASMIKSIGSSKTTTMERVSRVPTARASPQPATERVTRSSTRRAAPRT